MIWLIIACSSSLTINSDIDEDGFSISEGDCDDSNPKVYPGAPELCEDYVDNNCNGLVNEREAEGTRLFYVDQDGDGFAGEQAAVFLCPIDKADNHYTEPLDCDDNNPNIHPLATEACDELDNDCDGLLDDADSDIVYDESHELFYDGDDDGYGSLDNIISSCSVIDGFVSLSGDCDDQNADVSPGQPEVCSDEGVDENCDGLIDDGSAIDAISWYLDVDNDGFGVESSLQKSCSQPAGYVSLSGDCNNNDPEVYPNSHQRPEIPGEEDVDCDGNSFCMDIGCDSRIDMIVPIFQESLGPATRSAIVSLDPNASEIEQGLLLDSQFFSSSQTMQYAVTQPFGDGYRRLISVEQEVSDIEDTCDGRVRQYSITDAGLEWEHDLFNGWASDIRVADMDGDGDEDIVVVNDARPNPADLPFCSNLGQDLQIFLLDEQGVLYASLELNISASQLHIADLDADGANDIVTCRAEEESGAMISWGSSFQERVELPVGQCSEIESKDLDQDGHQDLIFSSMGQHSTIIWGDGARFSTLQTVELEVQAASSVEIGDFDQDGYEDLVFGQAPIAGNWSQRVPIFWGDSQRFASGQQTSVEAHGCLYPIVEQLGGNGYFDLICPNYARTIDDVTDYVPPAFVYWGSGVDPRWEQVERGELQTEGALYLQMVDMNEDGFQDLVAVDWEAQDSWAKQYLKIYWGNPLPSDAAGFSEQPNDIGQVLAKPLLLGAH